MERYRDSEAELKGFLYRCRFGLTERVNTFGCLQTLIGKSQSGLEAEGGWG